MLETVRVLWSVAKSGFCSFEPQQQRENSLKVPHLQRLCTGLAFVAFATVLSAQVVPHGLHTAEQQERLIVTMIDDGSVRRAALVVRGLELVVSDASADVLAMHRSTIEYRSGQRALSKSTLRRFEERRANSPYSAFAEAELGFAALEENEWLDAGTHLVRSANLARIDYRDRGAGEYKDLAHLSLFWLGASRAMQKQFAEAVEAFEHCISEDSTGAYAQRALFAMGQLYENNSNPTEAAAAYATIRQKYPRSGVVVASRIREAQMHLNNRNPERATDVLVGIENEIAANARKDTQVIAPQILVDHVNEELHLLRVSALLQRSRYGQALDTCEAFIRNYPDSRYLSLVLLNAGYAAMYVDSNVKAVALLSEVLKTEVKDASPVRQQALLYHAVALRRSGREAESGEAFADLSARADFPYQAQALVELGQGAYLRGDLDGARKILERTERSSTDAQTTIRARLLLGETFIEKQDWDKAADAFERAEQLASASTSQFLRNRDRYLAESRLKRGICLAQENQREQAIRVLTGYLGNHPNSPYRDEGTFWLAEVMYRSDLLRNAQELYEEIVNRYTASIRREEAMYGLAWTYFRKREFDKSVKMFGTLLSTFPKSKYATDALVRQGDAMYLTRRYAEAAKFYSRAAQTSGTSDESLYAGFQTGQALYRAGRLSEAAQTLVEYANRYPSSKLADDALYLSGWIAFQQHNDAQAVVEFERLLAKYPNGDQAVRALYTMADARYNMGNVQGAIDTYKQVVERYPNSALAVDAGKSMQMALIGEGRTDEAMAIADSWIAADPGGRVAQEFAFEKANIFYTGRNYKSAAAELQGYMAKYPQGNRADEAMYLLGKSYLSMDDQVQAQTAFAELEKKFPTSPLVVASKLDLAEYHLEQARVRVADSLYTIVQQKYANDTAGASRAGFERASIAKQLQDTASAMRLYRATADRYPGTEYGDQCRYQLAMYYRSLRMHDSARAELAVLVRTSPNALIRANALYDMGDAYARERRWPEAVEVLERVRTEYAGFEDWYTLSMIGLGACYEQMDEPDKAKEVYGTVAQLRPDDDYGKTATARLKRLGKKK